MVVPEGVARYIPGLSLLVALGILARQVTEVLPVINHLIFAVIIGMVITNLVGIPPWASEGVNQHKLLLETGIVLMGARLTLDAVIQTGPKILLLIIIGVGFTLLLVEALSRKLFGLPPKIGSLMASGAGICGVSAIVAVAGGIDAKEDQIAYAVAAVLVFDAVTLFTFPLVGNLLNLPDIVFGIWAGISMFSTGPVTAAGFAYSDTAGQWAALTKLTRNILISAVVLGYSVYYARNQSSTSSVVLNPRLFWDNFPKFIIGFVAVMLIANLGFLSPDQLTSLKNGYNWLFLFAFVGLGMNITLSDMQRTGIRPIALMLITIVTVATTMLVVVSTLFSA